jgi:hypothetical protein
MFSGSSKLMLLYTCIRYSGWVLYRGTSLLQELEHELLQNKLEKQKMKDKRKAKKRMPEELDFVGGSKKLKVKMGKEFEERNKRLKEKKKFREQKESIKKVRKVQYYINCSIHTVSQYPIFITVYSYLCIKIVRSRGSSVL